MEYKNVNSSAWLPLQLQSTQTRSNSKETPESLYEHVQLMVSCLLADCDLIYSELLLKFDEQRDESYQLVRWRHWILTSAGPPITNSIQYTLFTNSSESDHEGTQSSYKESRELLQIGLSLHFINARITFASILYPQCIYMIYIIYTLLSHYSLTSSAIWLAISAHLVPAWRYTNTLTTAGHTVVQHIRYYGRF